MDTVNNRIKRIVDEDFKGNISEFERVSNIKPST